MAGKLKEIAYELSKLWNYLTRQELCDYYGVTDRTLYNYQKQLGLDKKKGLLEERQDLEKLYNSKDCVILYVQNGPNNYKRTVFKNWNHFAVWSKAQAHPMAIDTMEKNGKTYTICRMDLNRKIPQAIEYEKAMNL